MGFQVNMCFFQMSTKRRSVRRPYARARGWGVVYCANTKVAMLQWEQRNLPFSGGRLGFHVNMRFSKCRPDGAACAARARGWGVAHCADIVQNKTVAMLPWALKWPLSGDRLNFQVNMRFCFRCRPGGAACAARASARPRSRAGGEAD